MLSVALGLAWYVHRAYTWSSSGCAVLLLPLCKNPLFFISLDTFICLFVLAALNGSTQPRELVSMLSVALGLACSCLLGMYTVLTLGRRQAVCSALVATL